MPLPNIKQPDIIQVNDCIRLKQYDGNDEEALKGYQDPFVYQNSEGIFDANQKPDIHYVKRMFEWLNHHGELYFIQICVNEEYISIGDVTIKDVNPPIAIWYKEYRSIGIGTAVMKVVIERLKQLGYSKISRSIVYAQNVYSKKMHERLGFKKVGETENAWVYEYQWGERDNKKAR